MYAGVPRTPPSMRRRRRGRGELLRDAEVEQHRVLAADDEHVLGLEVAVDEALLVQRPTASHSSPNSSSARSSGERAAREDGRERLALEPLHREVRPPIGQLADREHLDHRRVRDRLQALGLAEELRALALGVRPGSGAGP